MDAAVARRVLARRESHFELALVFITLFAIAARWPWLWFRRSEIQDEAFVDTTGSLLYLLLFLGSALILSNDWNWVFSVLRREPFLGLLVGLAMTSTLWAFDPALTLRRSVALALSALFGIYLVVRFPLPKILRIVAWVLLVRTAIDLAFVFGIPEQGVDELGRYEGRASGKNNLGRDSVMAGLFMFWQVLGNRRSRLLFLGGCAGAVLLTIGSESTTALVTIILLVVALPIYQSLRARRTLFGAVVLSLVGGSILSAAVALSQLAAITQALGKDVTLTGRTTLWLEAWREWPDRFLLGAGYDSFWQGWFSPAHDIWLALGKFRTPHAHNGLLDVLLDLGLLGAICYAAIFARGIKRSVTFCRTYSGTTGLWPLAYLAYAVLSSSTEHGIMTPNSILWVMFVVAVASLTVVTHGAVDQAAVDPPATAVPERFRQ